jgi:hypothetical protein
MIHRIWWFVTGLVTGGFITVRALRRSPKPVDLRRAAIATGADALELAAKAIRPNRLRETSQAR